MRRSTLAILVLLTGVAGALGAVGPASGRPAQEPAPVESIGIRLVEAPADAAGDPRAQMYIVDHLAPGSVIRRKVQVSSTAATTTPLELYAASARIIDGAFTGADGRTANELSSWTSVTPGTADLPAGGQISATVSIVVPEDAAPGEQYAVVWAESRSAGSDDGAVTQVNRVGIRLYVSVGPGGAPAADFTIESLTAQRTADGTPRVVASVRNTGGRALDLSGTLDLIDGPGGVRAGPFPAALGTTLAIHETADVVIDFDTQLPAGPWDATIHLRSGRVEREAHATITFPAAGDGHAVTITPHRRSLGAVIAGALALLILTALVITSWRRRKTKAGPQDTADDDRGEVTSRRAPRPAGSWPVPRPRSPWRRGLGG